MHAAIPRIGIQGTIFYEHEVLGVVVVIFTLTIFFKKNVKIILKLSVLRLQNI